MVSFEDLPSPLGQCPPSAAATIMLPRLRWQARSWRFTILRIARRVKFRRYQHAVTGDKSERKEGSVLTSALYPGRGCGDRVGGRRPARAARSGVGGHRDGTAVPATGQAPAAAELPVHHGR